MCDGITCMTHFCYMGDNFSEKLLPARREMPLWYKISYYGFLPFLVVFGLISSKRVAQDPKIQTSPIWLKNSISAGEKDLIVSKHYDFDDLRVYKKFNNTFNDFMLAVISKVLRQIFNEKGSETVKSVVCMIPVNVKPVPRTLESIPYDNNVGTAKFELPLIDEISEKSIKSIKRAFFKRFCYMYILTSSFL